MQSLGASLLREAKAAQAQIPKIFGAQRFSVPGMAETVLSRKVAERLTYEQGKYGQSLLKKGLIGMAKRAGAPEEMLREIREMDEKVLQLMYETNVYDFETYFSYEAHGGSEEKGIVNLTQTNTVEIEKMIAAYRKWTS